MGVLQFTGRKITPAGVAYAVVTRGSSDAAFTTGVSFTYGGLRQAEGARTPLVMLGGGIRMTRGHRSVDLGVATLVGADRPLFAPIFRFAWSL